MTKKLKRYIVPILILMLTDQMIKLLIINHFKHLEFDILGSFLRFRPIHNTNLSFAGNYIRIFSDYKMAVVFNVLVILLFVAGYRFYMYRSDKAGLAAHIIIVCGLAGSFCSLVDKIFWGGSLDFIQIPQLFTFDLKDCYISTALILFVIFGMIHNKEISIWEFLMFCFGKNR